MGAGDSRSVGSTKPAATVYSRLSDAERDSALDTFRKISNGNDAFNRAQLQDFLQRHSLSTFCAPVLELMVDGKHSTVNQTQFISGVHCIVSSGAQEQAQVIVGALQNGTMQLHKILTDLVNCCLQLCLTSAQGKSWNWTGCDMTADLAGHCAAFLAEEIKTFQKEPVACMADYERWITNTCHFAAIFTFVFRSIFMGCDTGSSLFPTCVNSSAAPDVLLSPGSLLAINLFLPCDFRQQWAILFDSKLHGESFSRFVSSVNNKGPCIIIILDESQNVFGVFASHGISIGPNFIGDARTFLFQSHPKVAAYNATGYDKSFAYANQNVKTLPNGIGFGGSIESGIFGLYLDEQLKCGQSRHCSTFNSPRLTNNETFEIRRVQVWTVDHKTSPPITPHDRSILDKNPDARVVLELSGKSRHSEGLREPESPD